jgi:hypothetical protein
MKSRPRVGCVTTSPERKPDAKIAKITKIAKENTFDFFALSAIFAIFASIP